MPLGLPTVRQPWSYDKMSRGMNGTASVGLPLPQVGI